VEEELLGFLSSQTGLLAAKQAIVEAAYPPSPPPSSLE